MQYTDKDGNIVDIDIDGTFDTAKFKATGGFIEPEDYEPDVDVKPANKNAEKETKKVSKTNVGSVQREDTKVPIEHVKYWIIGTDRNGKDTPFQPNYIGLVDAFYDKHPYICITESREIYIYKDKHWQPCPLAELEGFCEDVMNPKPNKHQVGEFIAKIRRTQLRSMDWFTESTKGFYNLKNCIYDIKNNRTFDNTPLFGFRSVLPYDYDKNAKCPEFEKFLGAVTLDRTELSDVIVEYAGYALSGDECKAEKAMFLDGEGSNGKSTFLWLLKALAGSRNYSSDSLSALNSPQNRANIDGKLFNVCEETKKTALMDSDVFKTLVSGGELDVKKLYQQPYSIRPTAKLIIACNGLPQSTDRTHGLIRKLLIVPFDATFTEESKDIYIQDKLETELSGIFNVCLEGYRRLKKNRYNFSKSSIIAESIHTFKKDNDNVVDFIEEKCEFDIDAQAPKDVLYIQYRNHAEGGGTRALSKAAFFKRIYKEYPRLEGAQRREKGSRFRAVLGIKIVG